MSEAGATAIPEVRGREALDTTAGRALIASGRSRR